MKKQRAQSKRNQRYAEHFDVYCLWSIVFVIGHSFSFISAFHCRLAMHLLRLKLQTFLCVWQKKDMILSSKNIAYSISTTIEEVLSFDIWFSFSMMRMSWNKGHKSPFPWVNYPKQDKDLTRVLQLIFLLYQRWGSQFRRGMHFNMVPIWVRHLLEQ